MCGIAGFNWADKKLVKEMTGTISHRGPDDEGFFIDEAMSLGHRRLSIIDLSKNGHQPMMNESKSVVVIYNGEIWNYKELKENLKSKHAFFSTSDTEVIVRGYQEYGEEIFYILDGMFAIALYDRKKKKLLLARDKIGKKPLYYYYKNKKLVFASEIKAILKYPEVDKKIDSQCLSDYLSLRYSPSDKTIFKFVRKLNPGTFMSLHKENISFTKYWNFPEINAAKEGNVQETKKLISKSVEKRLIADVPIGIFLSGGLDSSTIVACASKLKNVKTFSIGFGHVTDETKDAKIVAEHFGTEHKEIVLDKDIIKNLPKIVWHFDEPLADPAALPTYLLCKEVAKYVKVVLSGEGGDEVFGGYDTLNYVPLLERIQKIPASLRKYLFSPFVASTSNLFKYPLKQKLQLSSEIIDSAGDLKESVKRLFYLPFDEQSKRYLINNSEIVLETEFDTIFKNNGEVRKALFEYYFKEWIPNDLLMKADKMGMAHSLEIRTPFLDKDLVEYFVSLKYEYKNKRSLFRESVKDILPATTMRKKKQGFTLPISSWFLDAKFYMRVIPHIEDLIKRKILDEEALREILNNPHKFRNDHRLWVLLNLEIWMKLYVDNIPHEKIAI